jgi:hypothetical protein
MAAQLAPPSSYAPAAQQILIKSKVVKMIQPSCVSGNENHNILFSRNNQFTYSVLPQQHISAQWAIIILANLMMAHWAEMCC